MTDSPAALTQLAQAGVSVWLDDLSRERISSGNLTELITSGVRGVTTNPSIFQAALKDSSDYSEQLAKLAAAGTSVDDAVIAMTTDDVRAACDLFLPTYESTKGEDGRVSIEVDPRLAHDTAGTVEQAERLHALVDRPNVLIKIPATPEGLPAISAVLAKGISVNVTLIFSLERYRAVMNAFLDGLEAAREAGLDVSKIFSVASFFVSRVDTLIDQRLQDLGTPEALALQGKAGLANARLAYQAFEETIASARWQSLAAAGAPVQRPLWASTGVKNPTYPDTLYVTDLVAPHVVNTMPEKTLEAVVDHGQVTGDSITASYQESRQVLDDLAGLGIGYEEVTTTLENEGVEKFIVSWAELLTGVQSQLNAQGK